MHELADQIILYSAAIASTSFAFQGNMATSFIAGEIIKPEKNLRQQRCLQLVLRVQS